MMGGRKIRQALFKVMMLLFSEAFAHIYTRACDHNPCENDGICTLVNGVNQCTCVHGFQGEKCEDLKMEVFCGDTDIKVLISKDYFDWNNITANSIYLAEKPCKAISEVINGEEYYSISTRHNQCGTALLSNGTHIMFRNGVQTGDENGIITRIPSLGIDFVCVYPRQSVAQFKFPLQPMTALAVVKVQEGTLVVSMNLYKSSSYETLYDEFIYLALSDRLYFSLKTEGLNFILTINECWSTPRQNPSYQVRHDIIKNRCPADDTVQYHNKIGNETVANFSLQMFRFIKYPVVFLHCQVGICILENPEICVVNCPSDRTSKKQKRSVNGQVLLTYGPINWSPSEEHVHKAGKPDLMAAAVPGIAVVTVMMFLLLAIAIVKLMKN
uniref:Pancreatic secretory granule membrane major glycoprotein GP2-like n=1 Tax=Callorhinchus milii TaxID=7868 RepID=A0A4W3HDY6_CALMI|eukprot:gi/632972916/ref/XP_007902893.1/ PREDICTED: pancreatic secretory granule membrane major glycoprotein GP2-like [Callorhinchus milii]